MDGDLGSKAGLPLYILLPAVLLAMLLAIRQGRAAGSARAYFLIVAIALRTVLAALHTYTFDASPIGLSWNALASIAVCAAGLMVIRKDSAIARIALPLAPLILVMIGSAIANGTVAGSTTTFIKYVYFAVLAIVAAQASRDIGVARLMGLLLPIALLPLVFQIAAIPAGVTKAGETDGSVSYIGGFNHEAAYSVLLVGTLLMICFADRLRFASKAALLGWCLIGLFLANYRTAILGAAPLVGIVLLIEGVRLFVPGQRKLVGMLLIVLLACGVSGAMLSGSERFADLGEVWRRGSGVIQPPRDYSFEDRHLMSGRAIIWSIYIYAWRDGEAWQKAIGFGPDTWSNVLHIYAHNTLVSALYEIGVAGIAALLFLWACFLLMAAQAPPPVRARLVAAHLSFFVLNMATMPMWMIEGMIYYALLCGMTVCYLGEARAAPARRHARPIAAARGLTETRA